MIQLSVILAVYNGSVYLKDCIDSILCQTFRTFELIIINDGSTDSTAEIIEQYQDERIIHIDNKENKGLVESLNTGLRMSRGKYIARMDADDIALPNRFQVQFNFMESNPSIGICGSSVESFSSQSGKSKKIVFATYDQEIRAFAFFQSPFCHPTVMMRKEVLDYHGLKYPDQYYRAEDYALWISMLQYTQGRNIPSVLLRYRKHPGSETALADLKIEERMSVVSRVHKQYLAQNDIFLKSNDMQVYTYFTDRSYSYALTLENQQAVEEVLKKLLSQLTEKTKRITGIGSL